MADTDDLHLEAEDVNHLHDLTDLPRALIVKSVPSSVFADPDEKLEFENLFRQYDSSASFEYFKTFKRCRVTFSNSENATMARLYLNKFNFNGNEIKCFFAQILDVSSKGVESAFLQLPALEKQFLISPPASPPVGWEQSRESEPIINIDLISRLAALATDEEIHEVQPASDSYPSIIIHTCKEDGSEEDQSGAETFTLKPKICHTPRPASPCSERVDQ